jgi:integrase/recombinase XerD
LTSCSTHSQVQARPSFHATLLYHGLRREQLCGLRVEDIQSRQGVMHVRVKGKRDKIRFVPMHVSAQRLI